MGKDTQDTIHPTVIPSIYRFLVTHANRHTKLISTAFGGINMPYKDKKDKIEAQRRNRQSKREKKEGAKLMHSKVEHMLTVLGYESMTSIDFVGMILRNCVMEEDVVIDKNTGEALKDDANVFTGWNMVVWVDTPPIITVADKALAKLKELGASEQQ